MIHHVFANRSNVGDLLSARGIQGLLRRPVAELLCDDPFVADTVARLHRLDPEDVVIVGGGGLVMDYFTPLWEGLVDRRFRARLFIWGIGACDLKDELTWPSRDLLRKVVGKSEMCAVRDQLTRDFLGVGTTPVPCPSLSATGVVAAEHSDLLHVNNHSTVGATAYEAMRAAGQAHGAAVGLTYRETNNRIDRPDQVDAALERYHRARLVVSSALHGCVLAVATGRPVLAVSGDRKIEQFMDAAGLGAWVLERDQLGDLAGLLHRVEGQQPTGWFREQTWAQNAQIAAELTALVDDSGRLLPAGA